MNLARWLHLITLVMLAQHPAQSATKTWTGSASSSWFNPTNWNPVGVPESGDSVTIASGTVIASNTVTIDTLRLTGGSCTFSEPAWVGSLTMASGTLTGTNVVVVTNLVWTSGTMAGLGRTEVPPGGTLLVNPPSWVRLSQRALVNSGTAVWTNAGSWYANSGGSVTNTGTWEIRSDAQFQWDGTGSRPLFHNAGVLTKTGGPGTTLFDNAAFLNQGTVQVQRGTFSLQYGGIHNGLFEVATNALLYFSGGTHTWLPDAVVRGAGRVIFGANTTFNGAEIAVRILEVPTSCTFNSPFTADTLSLTGSGTFNSSLKTRVLTLTGTAVFNGSPDVVSMTLSGTANFNGPGVVGWLSQSAGTLTGTNVVVVTNLVWTSGTMAGLGRTEVPPGGTLLVNPPSWVRLSQRTLVNSGTAVWTNLGNWNANSGGSVTNTGTWEIRSDAQFQWDGTGSRPLFHNAGVLTKTGGSGTTLFDNAAFHNQGTVQVQRGTLSLQYGGIHNGLFEVATNALLYFSGGTHTPGAASIWSGQGRVQVASTLSMAGGTVDIGALDITSPGNCTIGAGVTVSRGLSVGASATAVFNSSVVAGTLSVGGNATFWGAMVSAGNGPISGGATFYGPTELGGVTLSGTANFNGPGVVGWLSQSAGTLTGTNVVVVTNLVWTSGTMAGLGRTEVPPGGTLLVNPPSWVRLSQRTLVNSGTAVWTNLGNWNANSGGSVTNTGTWEIRSDAQFQWDGTGSRPLFHNAGVLTKTGGSGTTLFDNAAFHNQGTVQVQRGTLSLQYGGIHNGLFEVATNALLYFSGGTHTPGAASIWSGQGRVQVASTLSMAGGTVDIGALDITSPGNCTIGAGVTVSRGLSVGASATAVFNSSVVAGTLSVGGNATFWGAMVSAGNGPISGGATFYGPTELGGVTLSGTANFNGPGVVGWLSQSAGTLTGTNVVVVTNLVWTSGTMAGLGRTEVPPGGTLLVNPPSWARLSQRALVNSGTAVWTNLGNWNANSGGSVTNTGTWEIRSDAQFQWDGTGSRPLFHNAGVLTKTGGSGTTLFDNAAFHNQGTVQVERGTLSLQYGGIHNGLFEVATNALLYFSGGTHIWLPGAVVHGEGRVIFGANTTFNGAEIAVRTLELPTTCTFNSPFTADALSVTGSGTFNSSLQARVVTLTGTAVFNGSPNVVGMTLSGTAIFNAPGTVGTLSMSSGTLTGTNVVVVTNLVWTSGTMAGLGRTEVPPGGTLLVNPPSWVRLSQRALVNEGTAVWTNAGSWYANSGGSVTNTGTWEIRSDAQFQWDGTGSRPLFHNAGVLTKTGGPGTTLFDNAAFLNQGTVELQKGTLTVSQARYEQFEGLTLLNGGALSASPQPLIITGGDLAGSGTITGNVSNNGAIAPGTSPGQIIIAGNFTNNGVINIELAGLMPGTQYDQLRVSGTAKLGGLLAVQMLGDFRPNMGENFTLLTHASRSGAFSAITGLDLGGGQQLQAIQTSTNLVLTSTNGPTNALHLSITSPTNNAQFNEEMPIVFNVVHSGGTPPVTYAWQSSLNGSLGSGSSLVVSTLSPGTHLIIVTGQDNAGATDGTSIQITVRPLATLVTIDLQPASDTGVSNSDHLTSDATPGFNVTVNKIGRIEFDQTGDGVADQVVTNTAPGLFTFTTAPLSDGPHVIMARFTPNQGNTVQATNSVIIDTTGPRVVAMNPFGTITNRVDFIDVSFDTALDGSSVGTNDVSITGTLEQRVTAVQTLASNLWRLRFATPLMPGDYDLAIGPQILDRAGNAMNQDGDGVNGEMGEDVFLTTLNVQLPDLSGLIQAAPTEAQMAQPVSVVVIVTNSGNVAARGPWSAALLLSTNSSGVQPVTLTTFTITNLLTPNQTLQLTQWVILPAGQYGERFLGLRVDSSDVVFEADETNNTSFHPVPLLIRACNLKPLVVTNPLSAFLGQALTVSWAVTNLGTGPGLSSWEDRLYLSRQSNSTVGAYLLASLGAPGSESLPAGAIYALSSTVSLPLGTNWLPGTYYLLLSADANNAQVESDESDNRLAAPIVLSLPPLPDLAVQEVAVPTTARPGETLQVSWVLTNGGTAAATGVWRESLLLSNAIHASIALREWTFTNTLNPGNVIIRTQAVLLPHDTRAGSTLLLVTADSRNDLVETTDNNNTTAAAMQVPPTLRLSLSAGQLVEGTEGTATVSHNGDRSIELRVTLQSDDPTEIDITNEVTIPIGASSSSFSTRTVLDNLLDGPQQASIVATAPGYEGVTNTLTVLDADRPRLTLIPGTNSVEEGLAVALTVTRDFGTNQPLTVSSFSSNSRRLTVPAAVVIPAGQWSQTFSAQAVADQQVLGAAPVTVSVSAAGFDGSSTTLNVLDPEATEVTLTITPATVSEGAGHQAALGTLTRGSVSTRALVADLVNSDPASLLLPAWISIPAGEISVSFPVGVVNNSRVDGDRSVTVTPYVTASGTGARLFAGTPGSMLITDDDGPTLQLVIGTRLVAEGRTNASTATVYRNTAISNQIEVSLTSSDLSEATVPPMVTIFPGHGSAQFTINSVNDSEPDGTQQATITASAAGFTPGSEVIAVTDVDLADLLVASIDLPAGVKSEAMVNLRYRIQNQGLGPTRSNNLTRVFLSDDPVLGGDVLVGEHSSSALTPGQYVDQVLQMQAPRRCAAFWLIVVTDATGDVEETFEHNNLLISTNALMVSPAFRATVETDATTVPAGTPITFRGRAYSAEDGSAMPRVPVAIHLMVRDTSRILSVTTDDSGNYQTAFTPLRSEAGFYTVGADHPGVEQTPVQDSFTLMGLQSTPAYVLLRATETESLTGAVSVVNLGDAPLTGLTATTVSNTLGFSLDLQLSPDGLLLSQGSATLTYSLVPSVGTSPGGTAVVRLSTTEGAVLDVPFYVAVRPLRAMLAATPASLDAGVVRGRQTMISFDLVNRGGATSGPVTLSLPPISWLTPAATSPLPSLDPGGSNRVSLTLNPPSNAPLATYRGSVILQAGTASLVVPFEWRLLSAAQGDLRVSVEDEYTYYAQGAPGVSNATVTVLDAQTLSTIAAAQTDAQGRTVFTNLAEAYYHVDVRAPDHNPARSTVLLAAGRQNDVSVFVPRQAVRYSWTVVPTEIEDRTRIELRTTFESFVPMPVITIEPASINLASLTQEVTCINFTLSNHGLVTALAGRFLFDRHPLWEVEPLTALVGEVPAMSSLTVPVTFRRLPPGGRSPARSAEKAEAVDPCNLPASFAYQLICGLYFNNYQSPIALYNAADCSPVPIPTYTPEFPTEVHYLTNDLVPTFLYDLLRSIVNLPGSTSVPSVSPPFDLLGWAASGGGVPNSRDYYQVDVPNLMSNVCDACNIQIAGAIYGCATDFLGLNEPPDPEELLEKAIESCFEEPNTSECFGVFLDTAGQLAETLGKKVPYVGQIISGLSCANSLLSACDGPGLLGWLHNQYSNLTSKAVSSENSSNLVKPTSKRPMTLELVQTRGQRVLAQVNLLRVLIGDDAWFHPAQGTNFSDWLLAFHGRTRPETESGRHISTNEMTALLQIPWPDGINATNLTTFVERWNRTLDYEALGIRNLADVPPGSSTNFIAADSFSNAVAAATQARDANQAEGVTNGLAGLQDAFIQVRLEQEQGSGDEGICGRISLQLDQQVVISRDAFRATLEIENGSGFSLDQVQADLVVMDARGRLVTDLFGVRLPELENLSAVDGTGLIPAGATATIGWTIIPSSEAAPEEITTFYVSGSLLYAQNGVMVALPLAGVPITVHPTPRLYVKYFHQRDVYADDPFTDRMEPSIPFSLAVMVENRGQGVARNVRITSGQPTIIENEKGLLANFQIVATEVEGGMQTPSLTASFGTIANGQMAIARWLMVASLQGLFTGYEASFEHIDGLGNPRLSLIEEVTIHEMIRLVQAPGSLDDGRPDFLVNNQPDPKDLPDTLYLSNGTTHEVSAVEECVVANPPSATNLFATLTAPMPTGWAYLRVPEPSDNQLRLVAVQRLDGTDLIMGTNVWTTDRTFIGLGRPPIAENLLHLLDHDSAGTYVLTYALPPALDTNAPSSTVAALPSHSPGIFQVQWSGQDDAGAQSLRYEVLVSSNNGPFVLWLAPTPQTSALYQGQQGASYAFYSLAIDQGGNREESPAFPDAVTTVTLSNIPPSFASLPTQIINEGQTLNLTLSAVDPDGSTESLLFRLQAGAPPGVILNQGSGHLTWPTTEATGPTTNLLPFVVTDNGLPPASITGLVTVVVREVNTSPTLSRPADRTINEGRLLTFTNVAYDLDIPANPLTFSLGGPHPDGATMEPTTGAFRWIPTELQGPSTNLLTVIVTDQPPEGMSLSATQRFNVVVRDTLADVKLSLGSTSVLAGASCVAPLWLESGVEVSRIAFRLEMDESLLVSPALVSLAPVVGGAVIQSVGSNRFDGLITAMPGGSLQGRLAPCLLEVTALSNRHSAIVSISQSSLSVERPGGQIVPNASFNGGRIFIIGDEPILDAGYATNGDRVLTLYGRPSKRYAIQSVTNLQDSAPWQAVGEVLLVGQSQTMLLMDLDSSRVFYRAFEASGLRLTVRMEGSQLVIEWPAECETCTLQETASVEPGTTWSVVGGTPVLTNGVFRVMTPLSEPQKFFRLRQ